MSNPVARFRSQCQWSQEQLSRISGVPRPTISAIELGRMEPGIAHALALARAFGTSVEALFSSPEQPPRQKWSSTPQAGTRFWKAQVGRQLVCIPSEPGFGAQPPHDGVVTEKEILSRNTETGENTLLIAGCDPALGFLSSLLAPDGFRVIVLRRSSTAALDMLRQGFVHFASVHWGGGAKENTNLVRKQIGSGWSLLRAAAWDEGVALAPELRITEPASRAAAALRWVGREKGSGANHCVEKIFSHSSLKPRMRHYAADHRGVAEAIRSGWAQAGVCIRLAAVEAGLGFLPVERENIDLCFAQDMQNDPRIAAVIRHYRSHELRQTLADLPGYHTKQTGEVLHVH